MLRKDPKTLPKKPLSNRELAAVMREIADRLQQAGESPFRVAAYRRAAVTFTRCALDLNEVLREEGEAGLRKLQGIGISLAKATAKLLRQGKLPKLERLRRVGSGEKLFQTLPGVGPELAKRVEQTLGAKTLHEVYAAAWDGRLRRVPGLGNKRLRAIRESLATRLQADVPPPSPLPDHEPPIAELLALDTEYLQQSGKNRLPRAIPRLFNPTGRAWLPILRTTRGSRRYTVRFANTARTHETGHLGDWVIITCDTKEWYGQWTVITSQQGDLRGRRVVMHREQDCREFYHRPVQQELPLS
jgi:hypothetical protein